MAFGKMFTQVKNHERKPPGINYFVKALQVGQAMRMAMAHGMHTCMPVTKLGEDSVERCRKIWWTVYILDRHMTSIQGLPQSIDDRFIRAKLPSSVGSEVIITALDMHIRLCLSIADINATVYAIDGRLNRTFILNIKAALSNLAGLADELNKSFPLLLEGTDNGLSRVSAYLHLFYQQCIIVATRPLLFCFLKIRLESAGTCIQSLQKSQNVRNLIKMCLESAQHSIRILHALSSQGLLETFLTFDLESIFTSTVVLLMIPAIDPQLITYDSWWHRTADLLFRDVIESGNRIARLRFSELQQLKESLLAIGQEQEALSSSKDSQHFDTRQPHSPPTGDPGHPIEQDSCADPLLGAEATAAADCVFEPLLTSAEMMAMANSIEMYDAEWVSTVMDSHDIW
ncbi:hypothetical protein AbraIFM66950_008996 [Aspergillus brasiliensis]|nr:hypothetical protein AbraIFM66950_008996 [Aspergillus brasiliensis]